MLPISLVLLAHFFYAYVSYQNQYYGESIIGLCLMLPIMVVGLVNWIKHQDENNTVIIKEVGIKELVIVIASQVVMAVGYYFLLKSFNTNNLFVSTISIVTSLIANYLSMRRSAYGFVGFIINDIILIILWSIPFFNGDAGIFTVLLCPMLLLFNDSYGVYDWKRIKNEQSMHVCC